MLHHGAQFAQQEGIGPALVDLRIVHRLHQRAEGDVLVARVVLQRLFRVEHGADLLALAAAGTDLHVGQQLDEPFLVGQAALADVLDEPVEREGERAHRQFALGQLGRVQHVARVHALLEGAQGVHLLLAQEGDLGDADAVLAGNLAAHLLGLGHDAVGHLLGIVQHDRVVGVDRYVDVTVAVARVHVAGHLDAGGLHVVLDALYLAGQVGVHVAKFAQKDHGADLHFLVRDVLGRNLALGHLGGVGEFAVEFLVVQRHARQASHLLQGRAVGGGRAFQVHLFEKIGELGHPVDGDDHVLVDLEAGGAPGDGGQLVTVFPEDFRLLLVACGKDVRPVVGVHDVQDLVHGAVQVELVVAVQLHDEHRNGVALVLRRLFLVFYGLDVLGVELLQGRYLHVVAFAADGVSVAHHVLDDLHGAVHGAPEEFQHQHARVGGLLVQHEAGLDDDAVHAFLLHAGQAAQGLVGHVLAKAGQADFVAAQGHHVAHAAAQVADFEGGRLVGHDLVARVVHPGHVDDLAGGGDHAPREQVVEGGAVFEGKGAARVFGNVAPDGRGQL